MRAGALKVAKRYAEALIGLAREQGPDYVGIYARELKGVAGLLKGHDELRRFLLNPAFEPEERQGVLREVVRPIGLSRDVINFMNLLIDKNRLSSFYDIVQVYGELADEEQQVVRARVVTARELSPAQVDAIRARLSEMTGKGVVADAEVDPALIGGVVVKIGSLVLDGSVRRALEELGETFKRGGGE